MNRIELLHTSSWQGVFYQAGGSNLLSALLTQSGASGTVLEAIVPYSFSSLVDILGESPASACSEQVARQLAMKSFLRAQELSDQPQIFGLGLTAALTTNRQRRGRDRAYVAVQTPNETSVWELPFDDKTRTREEQEQYLAQYALSTLIHALKLETTNEGASSLNKAQIGEQTKRLYQSRPFTTQTRVKAVLPGAFNPLHAGHRTLQQLAAKKLGMDVHFELCVHNVDKPSLDYIELQNRCLQLAGENLVLTNQPTFINKAKLLFSEFGGYFVVGVDTIERIDQDKYYQHGTSKDQAIAEFKALGVRFLVFGRLINHRFQLLDDLDLSTELTSLCTGISEDEFRMDISSTELRLAGSA